LETLGVAQGDARAARLLSMMLPAVSGEHYDDDRLKCWRRAEILRSAERDASARATIHRLRRTGLFRT
jgi:hypothetical protein